MAKPGDSAMSLSRPEEGNVAGHLMSKPGDGSVAGLLLPSNSSSANTDMKGCSNGDLMDSFGIFLQGLLGVVAFSTLMFLDTSKQAIGMLFIHFANVYLSDLTEEDPCSLYLINFLLDATLGMLVIYGGVRAVSVVVEWRQWDSLRFGEYGEPVQCVAWAGQCALYILIMMFEKVVIILVLLIPQWKKLAMLNPITNPQLELALVMLIVPFFVNAYESGVAEHDSLHILYTVPALSPLCRNMTGRQCVSGALLCTSFRTFESFVKKALHKCEN
ncbi:Store-operated calcium entry regulator STIMATE [Bagarius yarrelli]|uniref:Store-operated calcium entry regulator STIMATE n=1 Tax=Bagarius yarrelli TaxID=175774 RepID=A0A556V5H8_BAGYA|nr:Store-operated calcium entry regulator STIMATE [Bagarius yarrelli]